MAQQGKMGWMSALSRDGGTGREGDEVSVKGLDEKGVESGLPG